MNKETKSQKPFFASFLEAQNKLSQDDQQNVQGGTTAETQKYPSDQEDNPGTDPLKDVYQTQKYPSDQEDDPGNETQKYPSDSDEAGDTK